jgi:Acetyltransferase (GNAT) domain
MNTKNEVTFLEVRAEGDWNKILATLPSSHVYTSWSWGEYKERSGWSVQRLSVHSGGRAEAIGGLQLQSRKLGPLTFLLVQGGVHIRECSEALYHEVLNAFLARYVTGRFGVVALVNHQSGYSQDAELGLLRSGFAPLLNTSMFTYVLDRAAGSMSGQTLSGNWRHNLKRAQKNTELSCRWVTDPSARAAAVARLEAFYAGLRTRKSFAAAVRFEHARDLLVADENFKIVEAVLNNEVIATRIGVTSNDHMLDFLAASADAARNTYANYLLLWELIKLAEQTGKRYFDCGGIQPAESVGVFNFKKGLGGRVAVNGPLWVHGSSPLLRRVTRLLLSW